MRRQNAKQKHEAWKRARRARVREVKNIQITKLSGCFAKVVMTWTGPCSTQIRSGGELTRTVEWKGRTIRDPDKRSYRVHGNHGGDEHKEE